MMYTSDFEKNAKKEKYLSKQVLFYRKIPDRFSVIKRADICPNSSEGLKKNKFTVLREYFHPHVKKTRKQLLRFTHERMSELLRISSRAYSDLEHGRSGFSAVTLLLFLNIFSDEQIVEFVSGFVKKLTELESKSII